MRARRKPFMGQWCRPPQTEQQEAMTLDKPFLTVREAAALACCGISTLREMGLPSMLWAGKRVYRRQDVLAAMEAEWQRYAGAGAEMANTGISTGGSQADSVASRLARLQTPQKRKPASRSRPSKSNSGSVVQLSQSRPGSANGQSST